MIAEFDTKTPPNLLNFYHRFDDYLDFPLGPQQIKLEITGIVPWERLGLPAPPVNPEDARRTILTYSCNFLIRKNLKEFMISEITDSTSVHNVSVISSDYLNDISKPEFESEALQALVNNIAINTKRMLTDFINVKFSDTTGKLTNMKYNIPTVDAVLSKSLTSVPMSPTEGDRYLINGSESSTWLNYINSIAEYTPAMTWQFFSPTINQCVFVESEKKKYVWTGSRWMEAIFDIPFFVEARITKDNNIPISSSALILNIKNALLEHFTPKFGMDVDIDRSEIIKVIRSIEGVLYCKLLKPEIDLRFKYEEKDLELLELLDYTPQLVAFTYDSINISVTG